MTIVESDFSIHEHEQPNVGSYDKFDFDHLDRATMKEDTEKSLVEPRNVLQNS
jgi:hypothetical protein